MMQSETLFFQDSLPIGTSAILLGVVNNSVSFLLGATIAAYLFRPRAVLAPPLEPGSLMRRGLVVTVAYVFVYALAGYWIIWQSETARAFYQNGIHISLAPLIAFQLFRGALWALLVLWIVRGQRASRAACAVLTGLTFVVLTAAQLLYPNPFMPWAVRELHLLELASSSLLFGAFAGWLLSISNQRRLTRETNQQSTRASLDSLQT
jgi:hypothetical protein